MSWLKKFAKALNDKFSANLGEDATEAEVLNFIEDIPSENQVTQLNERLTKLEESKEDSKVDVSMFVTNESIKQAIASEITASEAKMTKAFETSLATVKTDFANTLNDLKLNKSTETSSGAPDPITGKSKENAEDGKATVNMDKLFSNTQVVPGLF